MKLEDVLALGLNEGDPVEIKNKRHNTHFEFLAYFGKVYESDGRQNICWYDEKSDIGKTLYLKTNDLEEVLWVKKLVRQ